MTDRTSRRTLTYARVSTAQQAHSGHGLDAQRERTAAYCAAMGWEHVAHVVDAGVSGAVPPTERAGLADALAQLADGRADVLVGASLSRIGRRTLDVLELADRAAAEGWYLVVLDLQLDTTSPVGRMALTVLAAVAELERSQVIERTTAALAQLKARGVRLGRPAAQATRAAGARAHALRAQGMSWRAVATRLTAEGYQRATSAGGPWTKDAALRAARSVQADRDAARLREGR